MPLLLCHFSFKYLPDGFVKRLSSHCLKFPLAVPKKASLPSFILRNVKSTPASSPPIKTVLSTNLFHILLVKRNIMPTHPPADHRIWADSLGSLPDSPLGQSVLVSYSSLNSPVPWSYYWLSFSPQNEHVTAQFYFRAWALALLIKQ